MNPPPLPAFVFPGLLPIFPLAPYTRTPPKDTESPLLPQDSSVWEPVPQFPHLNMGVLMQGWGKPGKTLFCERWFVTLYTGPPCVWLAITLEKAVGRPFWEPASCCPRHSESQKFLQVSPVHGSSVLSLWSPESRLSAAGTESVPSAVMRAPG